jgi:hypothetical protein
MQRAAIVFSGRRSSVSVVPYLQRTLHAENGQSPAIREFGDHPPENFQQIGRQMDGGRSFEDENDTSLGASESLYV